MLVEPSGRDGWTECVASHRPPVPLLEKAPARLRKLATAATLPASALVGFLYTPSSRLAANLAGGALTLALGSVTKSRLDDWTSSSARPALARLLLERHGTGDAEAVAEEALALGREHGADPEDFREMLVEAYAAYAAASCKNPNCKTSDIADWKAVRVETGLTPLEVGEAHAAAAAELYRKLCLFTPAEELDSDPEHPDRMSIDKCLFLSLRALSEDDATAESVRFEFGRVASAFGLTYDEATRRATEVAEPFYERALATARSKLDSGDVGSEMLGRARVTLGIDDGRKRDLHLAAYAEEVKGLFAAEGEGGGAFTEEALERLARLQAVLEIGDDDAEYERGVESTPRYQKAVGDALDAALSGGLSPDGAYEAIAWARTELAMGDKASDDLLTSIAVQRLGAPLEAADQFLKVGEESKARAKLLEAVGVRRSLFAVLEASGDGDEGDDLNKKYLDPNSRSSGNGFLNPDERRRLYESFVRAVLLRRDGAKDDAADEADSDAMVAEVASYLGMSEYDVTDTSRSVCGPLLEKELKAAAFDITGDDVTDALLDNWTKKIRNTKEKYVIPDELSREYGMNIYRDSLKVIALKCPSGIPSTTQAKALSDLRTLLSLSEDDVHPFHTQTFGPSYKKAVLESMGSTGVIPEEYRESLEALRLRLGVVRDDDVRKLFLQAVSEKLRPMILLLANELERTMMTQEQLAQRRGKDMGQDVFLGGAGPKGKLGLGSDGNLMGDIMNVVAFYKENDISQQTEIAPDDDADPDAPVVYETTYPVTALSLNAVEPEMAAMLYRQFLVGGFSAGDAAEASRYEAEAATFGGILGLSSKQMENIAGEIGEQIYENYITNALRSKDSLDQQDMMFLANIQGKLGFDEEQSAELMLAAQKKTLFNEHNAIVDRHGGFPPRLAKAFREKCVAAGMDPRADVGLPTDRVESLYVLEVGDGIESSAIALDTAAAAVPEIQEGWNVAPDRAEALLRSLVDDRCAKLLDQMDKEVMRGRDQNCLGSLASFLKFAAFVGGDFGDTDEERAERGFPALDDGVKAKLLAVYNAGNADLDDGLKREELDLLKTAFGMDIDDDDDDDSE